jgi:protein phosphatase
MIQSFGNTHVGLLRRINQDRFVIDEEAGLYVVADGMGGSLAGEVASQMTVEVVQRFVRETGRGPEQEWPFGFDPQQSLNVNRIGNAVKLANQRVFREADGRADWSGMGTTVVAALVDGDRISLASAGDSRAYRVRGRELEQLTTDDSWVQTAVMEGVLTSEEARTYPMRNILTKAVGGQESIELELSEQVLEHGDVYLLCSDGLHGMVTDRDILGVVLAAADDLDRAARDLIAAANERGGRDNITAILLRYRKS